MLKIALVHDWLVNFAGSERVLFELANIFPDAPIYTSVYDGEKLKEYFQKDRIRTSFLQKIPGAKKHYRLLFPLMPLAFESFDLSEYDIVISSSHACSKGVLTGPNTIHICYCHTPTRYLWSHYHEYIESINSFLNRQIAKFILKKMRIWDYIASQRVDYFIANSSVVQKRICKYYNKSSKVIFPPVSIEVKNNKSYEINKYEVSTDYYLALGRLVPYKRVDIAIQACKELGKKLIIAGDGPEKSELKKYADSNILFVGEVSEDEKVYLIKNAKALIFCADEDFGITPVEAMMLGTPVIAYQKGGAEDWSKVSNLVVTFSEQNVESLKDIILRLKDMNEDERVKYSLIAYELFHKNVFRKKIKDYIMYIYNKGE